MLTVITPIMGARRDRAPLFAEVMDCIQRQTYTDFEWIVVEQYEDKPLWRAQVKQYTARYMRIQGIPFSYVWCRNAGSRLAKGDILLFLDADMVCGTNYLEFVMEHFDPAGKYSVAGNRILWLNRAGTTKYMSTRVYTNDWPEEQVQWNLPVGMGKWCSGTPLMFTKDFFLNKLGGYHENFAGWASDDKEILTRAMAFTGDETPKTLDYTVLHLYHGARNPKADKREVGHIRACTDRDPIGISARLVAAKLGKRGLRTIIELPED